MAAIATAAIVALLMLWLFCGSIRWDRAALAQASVPEIIEMIPEEEEFFIEPEPTIEDKGEEDAPEMENVQEAPTEQGEPEPAPVDNDRVVVKGDNPKPAPIREKPVVQKQESPVKATTPPKSDKPEQKVTSKGATGFSGKNGKPDGKAGGFGTGGAGTASVKGTSRGRQMLDCPRPSVSLKNTVTIVVNVSVREDGTVASAKATGSAEQYLRQACEQAALKSKWTPKPGVGTVQGTITFTIIPKL